MLLCVLYYCVIDCLFVFWNFLEFLFGFFFGNSSGIPDDLALVLSKELDRAARRAAKTIDAASAAVSVTSLFSKSVRGGDGKKTKTERQVKHGERKEGEVKEDGAKERKVVESPVREVVEVTGGEERKVEEVESFIM